MKPTCLDSSGWIKIALDGTNAKSFAKALSSSAPLIVSAVSIYEIAGFRAFPPCQVTIRTSNLVAPTVLPAPIKPQPPATPSPTRRDDLAAVVRDANLSDPASDMNDDSLLEATRQFIKTLESEGIPHVLVGGLAVLQYVAGRNTRDIDLIIALEDLERLPGFRLDERNEWFATGTSGPLRVDLLFTANPLFAQIMAHHSELRTFLDARLRCATPEGIVLLKLFALPSLYRQGNIDRAALYETDILQLLHHHPAETGTLLATLTPHMTPSDINALRDVLKDIQTRIDRLTRF